MFGMSSEEFWEESPQLYWAYRTFYMKKISDDMEAQKFNSWLQGYANGIALSIAINNNFAKDKKQYPKYEEMFKATEEEKGDKKELSPKEEKNRINLKVQEEFNAWARF